MLPIAEGSNPQPEPTGQAHFQPQLHLCMLYTKIKGMGRCYLGKNKQDNNKKTRHDDLVKDRNTHFYSITYNQMFKIQGYL